MEENEQDRVLDILLGILRHHPGGIKEYDLLRECRGVGLPFLEADSLLDSLVLFRVHFLLFHCLYLLQARLRSRGEGDLEIHCLDIRLKPWTDAGDALLELADPLRGYYMDLDRLESMTRADAEALIDGFWRRFDTWDRRRDALAILGLEDPVDQQQISRRFRQLAMTHHPDHGGDPEEFRQLADAMEMLR